MADAHDFVKHRDFCIAQRGKLSVFIVQDAN